MNLMQLFIKRVAKFPQLTGYMYIYIGIVVYVLKQKTPKNKTRKKENVSQKSLLNVLT